MTRLRVATWNVHEAIPVGAGRPDDPSSFWAELVEADVDVAALQEVCFAESGESSDLAMVAERTRMAHAVSFPLSVSSFRRGQLAGLALLSRHPLRDEQQLKLPNPGLRHGSDEAVGKSHDKGLLSAVLELRGGPVRVASLHIPPFHRFGRAPQEFGTIWAALAKSIASFDDLPLLVCGDFNTSHRGLLTEQVERRLHRAIGNQDTHGGRAADDILYTDPFEPVMSKVIGTQSDHALCLAEFEALPGPP
jgi:endonuclease/exonuclease/phosphatase family metal-dependent hydrolase